MNQNYLESVRLLRDLWFWFKLRWVVTFFLNIMNKGFEKELMYISLPLSMFTASRASCGKLRSPDVCVIGNSYFFANRRNAQRDCMGNHMHQRSLKIQPFRMVRVKILQYAVYENLIYVYFLYRLTNFELHAFFRTCTQWRHYWYLVPAFSILRR